MSAVEQFGDDLSDDQYRLLVPIFDTVTPENVRRRLRTAGAIAHERGGGLIVCYIATVARQTPLDAISADDPVLTEAHEATSEFVDFAAKTEAPVVGYTHLTHETSGSVLNMIGKYRHPELLNSLIKNMTLDLIPIYKKRFSKI